MSGALGYLKNNRAFYYIKEFYEKSSSYPDFGTFYLQKLFRFVLSSIAMMILTSVYGVIDGLFIFQSRRYAVCRHKPYYAPYYDFGRHGLYAGHGRHRPRFKNRG